jgi:cysteinyl-tRNA synthetase
MSNRYLGKTMDIHCGGQDLQFPHHENEIAQSEAANGCNFVNYWLHNGFLNIDNIKMSKSEGNFFTVRDAAAAYGYEPIRFFMLSAHYRSPLNYSRESLTQAQSALERLYTAIENLDFLVQNGGEGTLTDAERALIATFDDYRARFDDSMDDDLNTADAIGVLFELVRAVNTAVEDKPTRTFAAVCREMIREFTDVLGLLYDKKKDDLDSQVEALIDARQAARKAKNFAEADRIRDELKDKGVEIMDTPQGVKWKKLS